MSLRLVRRGEHAQRRRSRPAIALHIATAAVWLALVAEVLIPIVWPVVQWPIGTPALTGSVAVGLIVLCAARYLRSSLRHEADRTVSEASDAATRATTNFLHNFVNGITYEQGRMAAGLPPTVVPRQGTLVARGIAVVDSATAELPRITDAVVVPIRQFQQPRPRPRRD